MIELQLENIANEIEKGSGEFLAAVGATSESWLRTPKVRENFILGVNHNKVGLWTNVRDVEYFVSTELDSSLSSTVSFYSNALTNAIEGTLLGALGDTLSEDILLKSRMYRYCKMQLSWNPNEASEYLLDGKGARYLAAKHFLLGVQ